MTPIRKLALRLLKAEGFASRQIAEALSLDPRHVQAFSRVDCLRHATMAEIGAPASNSALFEQLVAAAERYLGVLPAVAALRRTPRGGRKAKAA